MTGIVIVGGGIAGQALCEALRERDCEIPVTLLCGEPRLPYDRVRLSDAVDVTLEDVFVRLRPFARRSSERQQPARAAARGGTA